MSNWKGKKAIVTGANGFIGSWLCKALAERQAIVTAVVHGSQELLEKHKITEKVNCIKADIDKVEEIQAAFEKSKPDICFHLAAKSLTKEKPEEIGTKFQTNVMGTLNVLAASKSRNASTVFVSSVKTYGGFAEKCFAEQQQLNGTSAYAASKIAAEAVCRMFAKNFGQSIAIARLGNVFGGYDSNSSRIVPRAVKNMLQGKPAQIKGKGESSLDFVYVEDVVKGLLLLGEKAMGEQIEAEAFNFGSGKSHSVKEVVAAISKILCSSTNPVFSGTEKPSKECLCIGKAEKLLGWKPKYSLEEGLRKTVECFKQTA